LAGKKQRLLLFSIPAAITIFRAAIAFVVFYLILNKLYSEALALFLLAGLSDWLDGFLARNLNARTDFGAFLDATADKILILLSLFALNKVAPLGLWWGVSSWIAFWILFSIEFALIALRLPRLFSCSVNVHAGKFGKLKFIAEVMLVSELLLLKSAELFLPVIVFAVFSLAEHLKNYRPSSRRH
jgi:CDP-diacylglycerol--glycerol-3-phosphate 3-phosphatidyltransferase